MRDLPRIRRPHIPVLCSGFQSVCLDSGHLLGRVARIAIIQKMIVSVMAFLICLSGLPASAATYYVAPGGSDSNPGTVVESWKTIQKGAHTAAAGDTVVVQPGIYDERVTILRPGITFRANGDVTNR